jgi:hypothetical protein
LLQEYLIVVEKYSEKDKKRIMSKKGDREEAMWTILY